MALKYILVALVAPQLVYSHPQFGFINSLASQALGFGESIASDFTPPTQAPQSLPPAPSAPAVITSAPPAPSSPPPQPPQTTIVVSSTSQLSSPTSSPVATPTTATHSFHTITAISSSHTSTSSQTTSKASSTVSPLAAEPTESAVSKPSHSNGTAIAVAVVCVVLAVSAALGLVWFFLRRKNKKSAPASEDRPFSSSSTAASFYPDDEKPLARYNGPLSSKSLMTKPLPAIIPQRKYLPYRPPCEEEQPSIHTYTAPFSTHIAEIDGKPIEAAPVELEGCSPVTKAENKSPSHFMPSSKDNSQAQESVNQSSHNSSTTADAAATSGSTGHTEAAANNFKIARKPTITSNH